MKSHWSSTHMWYIWVKDINFTRLLTGILIIKTVYLYVNDLMGNPINGLPSPLSHPFCCIFYFKRLRGGSNWYVLIWIHYLNKSPYYPQWIIDESWFCLVPNSYYYKFVSKKINRIKIDWIFPPHWNVDQTSLTCDFRSKEALMPV